MWNDENYFYKTKSCDYENVGWWKVMMMKMLDDENDFYKTENVMMMKTCDDENYTL